MARILGYASAAITPRYVFAAPTRAVHRLLERRAMKIGDFDLIEVNEAFAAQTLANGRELDWDWSRMNVNGDAIALGHPTDSSGSRVLITLIHELRRRGRGLATLCLKRLYEVPPSCHFAQLMLHLLQKITTFFITVRNLLIEGLLSISFLKEKERAVIYIWKRYYRLEIRWVSLDRWQNLHEEHVAVKIPGR